MDVEQTWILSDSFTPLVNTTHSPPPQTWCLSTQQGYIKRMPTLNTKWSLIEICSAINSLSMLSPYRHDLSYKGGCYNKSRGHRDPKWQDVWLHLRDWELAFHRKNDKLGWESSGMGLCTMLAVQVNLSKVSSWDSFTVRARVWM